MEAEEDLLHEAPEGEPEVLADLAQVGERRAADQLVRVRHLPEEGVDQLVPVDGSGLSNLGPFLGKRLYKIYLKSDIKSQ